MPGETLLDNPLALKANYEALINSLDDLIWSVSSDFKLIAANTAFIESMKAFTGITVKPGDDLLMRDIFHNDYLFFWEDAYHKALKGASLKKEIYKPAISNRPGSWTETRFNPIYKDGKITAIACYSRDITEKKIKEELLIKSEARLAEAQAVAKVGSWETDLLNYNVTWSMETLRIFELDQGHFKSSYAGFLELVHPNDRAKVDKAFTDSLESAHDNAIEHRIILKYGSIKWVQVRWRIIRDDQNKPVRATGTCQDITERKSAEEKISVTSEALQNNLNDINKIMDSSLDVICVVDVNGYFKKVSAACEVVFGYKAEELVGKLIFDFVYPKDLDKTKLSAEKVMFGNYVPNFTNRYVRKDGSLVDIEWSASWHAGDQVRYGIARDVTEKKRIEKAFAIERQRFNNLYLQAPSCMGILKGPDHVFEIANPLYLQLIGKKDIIGKTVKEVLPELEAQGVFDFLDSVYKTGETFSANEMLVQFDLNGNGDLVDKYLNFIYQAHRNNEGIIDGILFFVIDVTEQVISRKKIEESEQRYRTLFEQNLAGFYQSTLSGKILSCNDAFAKMLGYDSPQDLLKKDASELYFSSEERNEFINNLKDQKYLNNYEGIIKRKDGRALYYLENVTLKNDPASGVDFFDGILIDITDKKIAEVALAESENYLRTIIAAEPECVKLLDEHGLLQEMNPAGLAMIEADSLEDVKGKSILNIVNEPYRKSFHSLIKGGFKGIPGILEFEITGLKGTQRWLETNSVPLRNREGEIISLLSVTRDITERKRSEENILKSNERFINVSKATSDAVWDWDIEEKHLYLGDSFKELFGYDMADIQSFSAWADHIHPEDRERVIAKRLNKIINREGENWKDNYRYLRADGSIAYVLDRGILLRNSSGTYRMIGAMQDVTDINRLEALLKKANDLSRTGTWEVDLINNTTFWSQMVKEIHEVSDDYLPDFGTIMNFIKEGDEKDILLKNVNDSIENGLQWQLEFKIITAKGNELWVSSTGDAEFINGKCVKIYGSIQDIDERKKAKLAFINSLEEKNTILESIGDAFFAVDKNWIVTYWNNQAEKMLLTYKKDIVGHHLWEVFDASIDSHSYKKYYQAVETREVVHFEDYHPALNKWYEISAYPSASGLSVYFKDVTERKLSDIQLIELNENIRRQSHKLAASNEELERFAYVASHDLQEPLRMVSSFLQLLKTKYDQQLDDTAQKYINFAVDGADRMKILILDLLEFSRISSLAVDHTIIDLSEVVTKTRMALKSVIDESQAKINAPSLPKVCGNESQLLQLFQNLISNAIKYRDNLIPEIEITCSETSGQWQFCVQDNGIGIDATYHDKIFIIFQRLHNKKDYTGTGIGLAICKKIAELHGGKIWVESAKGNGSKFYFTISKLQNSTAGGAKILCPALAENAIKQLQ